MCNTIKHLKVKVKEMLDLLVRSFWLALVTYLSWFLFMSKTFQSLSSDDLTLTWKLHKKQTGCKASHIHTLHIRNNEVVGFQRECGNDYLQKRLMTKKAHTYIKTGILGLSSPKITNLLETKSALDNRGLHYSRIKQIELIWPWGECFLSKQDYPLKKTTNSGWLY